MKQINLFILVFVFVFAALFPQAVFAEEPLPPAELIEWLDYALKRYPPVDCPHLDAYQTKCAAVTDVKLSGDLQSGSIEVVFTGYNWSRTEQFIDLLGPSSSFSMTDSSIVLSEQNDPEANDAVFITPFFDSTAGYWKLKIPPGKFELKSQLQFVPQSIVPLNLVKGIGRVNSTGLKGGYIHYDENVGNHGGEVQLVLEGEKKQVAEKPQVRVTRIFNWGIIPTFEYVFTVSGLQSEAPLSIPLLSNEVIEKTVPEKPYNIVEKGGVKYFETTFSPQNTELKVEGHYKKAPQTFTLGKDLPFEIWIHVSDRRYPVTIQTNSNPVDPSEFKNLINIENARAFMVKPEQKMAFQSVNLKVDEGRKGKGNIQYRFYEGAGGFWREKLFLTAQILGQDRLVIPTPKPPTYAGIGKEGIELFHNDKGQLSVRLPREGLKKNKSIEVAWNQRRSSAWFLDLFRFKLPAQNVYLEEQEVSVFFSPGVVPIYAWGGAISKGDLLDQFHLYGFLIGILAFFICRGLKFNWVLSGVVTLLFVGLYLTDGFPTTAMMILLILTLPLVRLKDEAFEKLKTMRLRRRLILLIWLTAFIITLVPMAKYARTRVFEALHPYAGQTYFQIEGSNYITGGDGSVYDDEATPKTYYKEKKVYKKLSRSLDAVSVMGGQVPNAAVPQEVQYVQSSSYYEPNQQQTRYKLSEYNAKPVSLNIYTRGGNAVEMTSYNILPGKDSAYAVLTAGFVLRGFWMLVETVLILWMMTAVVIRTRRLFNY